MKLRIVRHEKCQRTFTTETEVLFDDEMKDWLEGLVEALWHIHQAIQHQPR